MQYNWQQKDWPNFTYDLSRLEEFLFQMAEGQGQIAGILYALPEEMQAQSEIDIMVAEAVKTSAIEGEYISREDVLSSIRNNLGLNRYPENIKDRRAEGVARLMLIVRDNFAEELSEEMLFDWHSMLMEPYTNINIGQWRFSKEPMRIISGSIGREIIHFEAPPSSRVPKEMSTFIGWFNQTASQNHGSASHPAIRAAIAHLYFESIHPFEDGNGRIGRALSEKILSQGAGRPILLSLSHAIESNRQDYYDALKKAQASNEITPWINYFVHTILAAQSIMKRQLQFTISKTHFFDKYRGKINARQEKVLSRMFEAGPKGFKGGMSAKKYMSMTKISKATATRDLQTFVNIGALIGKQGGRSTNYELNI